MKRLLWFKAMNELPTQIIDIFIPDENWRKLGATNVQKLKSNELALVCDRSQV